MRAVVDPGDSRALRDSAQAVPLLRDARGGVVAEVVAQLAVRAPSFQDLLDPEDPEGVPRMVELAVDLLVGRVAAGVAVQPDGEQLLSAARELGRLQARDGRLLSDLLDALRTAGR